MARTCSPTFTFRPRWAPRGTTEYLPTTVMPVLRRDGSWRLGGESYGPSPTMAPWPTTTSLSRMARSTTAPARTTESNITMESRTTAPTSTRTPGERTLFTTVPLITQPCEIMDRWTWAVGPIFAGARSSDRVWISHSLSYRSSSGESSRSAMLASQNDWMVPTSCQ